MADNVLSTLSIQLEAQQTKLDRDLDQAENKAKKSGEKMEQSLSLGGVASKLLAAFAVLGFVEAGFKSITAITSLLDGDLQSALDTIETLPFGLGPAVAAARDFFEVVSGSRKEAERLAEQWSKVAEEIKGAQSEVDALAKAQKDADTGAVQALDNRRQRINALLAQYTDLINQLNRFDAEQRSGLRFEGTGQSSSPIGGFGGADTLKQLGIEGESVDQAIRELRERILAGLTAGKRATLEDFIDLQNTERQRTESIDTTRRREQLQADGNGDELKRLDALLARNKQLVEAQSDLERQAIEDLYQDRLRRVEDEVAARARLEREAEDAGAERAFAESQRRAKQAAREREQEARAAQVEAQQRDRDAAIRSQGIGAQEFLRTSFESGTFGKTQEVKDADALDALNRIDESIQDLGRVRASPAVLT